MVESYKAAARLVEAGTVRYRVAAGFDGFCDILARPILRNGVQGREYFPTIASFGEYLVSKAAMSCSIELEPITEKIGGNMPIYSQALSVLGVGCDCIGTVGYPKLDDAFTPLSEAVTLTGVENPGHCTALEFSDGKVMLARNNGVDGLDYDLLVQRVGTARLERWITDADAIALLNWSEMRGASSIWRGLLDHVLPTLPPSPEKLLLLDVSDCSRRDATEVRAMAALTRELSTYFRIVFSMNRNEAQAICNALSSNELAPDAADTADTAAIIRDTTGVSAVVIHLLDGAYVLDDSGGSIVSGQRVDNPLITTGGGDNFNAGLTLGLLGGLGCRDAAALANAAGGFYVVNGRSASTGELFEFIHKHYLEVYA